MLYSFILEFINTKNPITKMRCLHSISSVYIPRVVLNTNIIICILYVVVSRYAIPYVSIHQINEMLGNYKTQKKAFPPFYVFFFYVFICLLLFLDFYAYLELWYHVCCLREMQRNISQEQCMGQNIFLYFLQFIFELNGVP